MMDVEKVADSVFKAVESRIEKAIAPLLERLAFLEAKELPKAEAILAEVLSSDVLRTHAVNEVKAALEANPPKDGKDAEPIVVSEVVAELLATDGLKSLVDLQATESVAAYFAENPVIHGKDADPVSEEQIAKHVSKYMEDNPLVAELLEAEGLKSLVSMKAAESVTAYLSENPVINGKDAEPVSDEQLAKQVSKYMSDNPVIAEKGDPGTGLADAMIDRTGNLVLTMTDGRMKELGLVVGKDGNPGKDGADGLGFDDLTVSFDGEGIVHEYKRGEKAITQRFPLNVMKHIGFWRAGMEAKSGNVTTHNGCSWLCLKDTSESPSYEAKDWILSARKGRDGLDAKDAKPPEPVKLHGN